MSKAKESALPLVETPRHLRCDAERICHGSLTRVSVSASQGVVAICTGLPVVMPVTLKTVMPETTMHQQNSWASSWRRQSRQSTSPAGVVVVPIPPLRPQLVFPVNGIPALTGNDSCVSPPAWNSQESRSNPVSRLLSGARRPQDYGMGSPLVTVLAALHDALDYGLQHDLQHACRRLRGFVILRGPCRRSESKVIG